MILCSSEVSFLLLCVFLAAGRLLSRLKVKFFLRGEKEVRELAEVICEEARKRMCTFADVRLEVREGTSILVQDGRADKVAATKSRGVGIRVLVDGAWGFTTTSRLERRSVFSALERAFSLARASKEYVLDPGVVARVSPGRGEERSPFKKDPRRVGVKEKAAKLLEFEKLSAKAAGGRLVNSVLSYGDSMAEEIIANTKGALVDRRTVRTSIFARMTALEGEIRQTAYEHRANICGFELVEELSPEEFSIRAAKKAIELLSAKPSPAGSFPVVFHPSITGLLVHEALGHNAEADLVWTGESILEGKLGEKIASSLVTIVDDATIPNSYGSYKYDSEGTPGGRCVIIEKGILKGFLHSLETASKFGVEPNGSARAQGYSHRPVVRMSNTFMEPGEASFEEIIKPIERGIFLDRGQWGYVLVERGQYTCHAGSARMIEHGQLGEPLRDVSVSGLTLETLKDIEAASSDFEMEMPGHCGKAGQAMPVNTGGPYVRVKSLIVGGQS